MADAESSQAPRRSQRDKKPVTSFSTGEHPSAKRKRDDADAEGEFSDLTDMHDESIGDVEDEGENYRSPKPKPKATSPMKMGKNTAKDSPVTKKSRNTKNTTTKPSKGNPRTPKKPKAANDVFDTTRLTTDTKINGDNPLFNAILNPAAALQSTAEDFLESLNQNPGSAQAELINCVLRACGSNDTLDADEVLDYDGVLDALDNFTEALKQENSPVYPLTSKLLIFKKFRKSLSEFIERLILSSAELGTLYSTDLMWTLQAWVVAMSSSQIRSFRHTATVIALEVETALCDVASSVEKEAEVVGRQKEGEKKRKANKKTGGAKETALEGKAAEIRERRAKLAEFLGEFIDGVFVHRYRDLDPNIRAECVKALGLWFKKYPAHFLDSSYLRYVGWVLSDESTHVRLESVKALSGVYQQVDYISSLNLFTERFKPRLIDMANGDTDLGVRVAVIQVLAVIDEQSLLEDEEREKLSLLLFDEEVKVRKAVSGFVKGIWEEMVDERLLGRQASEEEKERVGMKALAVLFVKWGKTLDEILEGDNESDDQQAGALESRQRLSQVAAIMSSEQKGRTALAVEALWDHVEAVGDWEGLLDILLLDHSAAEEGAEGSRRRKKVPPTGNDQVVNEIWRLEEAEETVLLEVFVASLRKAKMESVAAKKSGKDTATSDYTRALIKSLPGLFVKYQTDENRIANVLLLPLLMNLEMYLEMRMISVYANLWDDVTKQFLSHSSATVLNHGVACIRYLMEATSLSNTNSTKILELEDELSSSLRDTVAGRDEIEVASLSEDEVLALTAICSRLANLAGSRDMTSWIEENEGGKQSSAWDIISALVERGRLGYKEEEQMIDQALKVLNLHIIWKAKGLTTTNEPTPEELESRELLKEQRDALVDKVVEYAIGTQSNTADGVKRSAFQILLNLHILFCPAQATAADGSPLPTVSMAMFLDDEVQYRCAGYIDAEIERYVEDVGLDMPDREVSQEEESDEDDNSQDDIAPLRDRKAKTTKGPKKVQDQVATLTRLGQEYVFMGVIATFLRAVRAGAIQLQHGAVLLAHYGRLGPAFDACSKVIVDLLKEEIVRDPNGEMVTGIVIRAIQESFTLLLDHVVEDETYSNALAKLLASCFVVRGPHLAIVQRLDSQCVVRIHTTLHTWIGKRLAAYEINKNKRARDTAILFFRILVPLLVTIDHRDVLKIKAHLDQILAQAKVEILPTSKIWEPYRAYEKKLTTAMKDKTPATKRKGKGAKTNAMVSSDGEESEVERLMDELPQLPRPKPTRRSARLGQSDGTLTDPENENDQPAAEAETSTPKVRPRPKPTHKRTASSNVAPTELPFKSPAPDDDSPQEHLNGFTTPVSSRKRARAEPEQEVDEMAEDDDDSPSSPTELQIRKRVRH